MAWIDIQNEMPAECTNVKIKRTDGKVAMAHFDRWFLSLHGDEIELLGNQKITHWKYA